jgi:CDP-paratose synthetase
MSSQKTILLTGANGFLGSNLLEALLSKGFKLVILKRTTSNIWRIQHLLDKVICYNVDVQNLELAFSDQKIDYVIHTACHYGRNGDPISKIVNSNLMFGLQLLDACIKYNTDTFFNTDTLLNTYLNVYTLSKKQFVDWLKQNSEKIQVVNLKLEHIYGPKDDISKFLPWLITQLKENVAEIKLTEGKQLRDFIYIDDVVSAYIHALENVENLGQFTEFDVGTGKLISVKDFILKIKEQYESRFGLTSTQLLFGEIPYRVGEMMSVKMNIAPLKELGWKSNISIEIGIQNIVQ